LFHNFQKTYNKLEDSITTNAIRIEAKKSILLYLRPRVLTNLFKIWNIKFAYPSQIMHEEVRTRAIKKIAQEPH
jgi:hypothetical protein